MIRGIKFVNVPVTNQDKAVKFYTEKLGFRVLTDQPFDEKQRWIELGIPGGELYFSRLIKTLVELVVASRSRSGVTT